ncbi:ROK family protein [Jiangella asiatica]|uniref:ROK family protein n=1 Tax=Jiangella asiatica TaxID=2530372 RepID=A0A4V2Z2A8_9ACTN|nr:ROK family protein [Jiangella asiatica]TDE08128.1 ROK family protein [Jiangella asiatica]
MSRALAPHRGAGRAGIVVDIGGTKIESAESRAPDVVHRVPSGAGDGAIALGRQVLGSIQRWEPRPGERIVVASAGHLDLAAGRVLAASNLPWRDHPLTDTVAAATGCDVELIGDASAAAVAELTHPSRSRHRHGLYVTVSTGIGMGAVRDGLLDWEAGTGEHELGHVRVVTGDDAAPCGCGRRGCLEAYSSGPAILRRYREILDGSDRPARALAGDAPASVADVVGAAERGEHPARLVLDQALDYLAGALSTAVRRARATVLVLGGGAMTHGGLFASLRDRMHVLAGPGLAVERPVHGLHSAIHGAARMCEREPRTMTALARNEEGVR